MEIRLTRRPGTKKFTERYGERLVCVRYRYDEEKSCRHKTVELIVETVPWTARGRRARRRDEEMVAVRIGYNETELRERAKRLGAIWRLVSAVNRSYNTHSGVPRRARPTGRRTDTACTSLFRTRFSGVGQLNVDMAFVVNEGEFVLPSAFGG